MTNIIDFGSLVFIISKVWWKLHFKQSFLNNLDTISGLSILITHLEKNNKLQNDSEKIIIDLRVSLGLPKEMKRTKIINIYWSTGKLLELANVKKLNIKDYQKTLIKKLREAKSNLKTELNLKKKSPSK